MRIPEDLSSLARGVRQARDLRTYRRLAAQAIGDPSDPLAVAPGPEALCGAREAAHRGPGAARVPGARRRRHGARAVRPGGRLLRVRADGGAEVGAGSLWFPADGRWRGGRAGRRWNGEARGAGAQRGKRHRPDPLLRDGRRAGRRAAAPRALHARRAAVRRYARRGDRRWRRLAGRSAPAPRGDTRPAGQRARGRRALLRDVGAYVGTGRPGSCASRGRGPVVRGQAPRCARALRLAPSGRSACRRGDDGDACPRTRGSGKRGHGGSEDRAGRIREVEFFAQSLQLVWGGREPRVRGTNTLDALRRLRARGFVSEREEVELSDAYLFLRRLEHRIQYATGLQTHALPRASVMVGRIAKSLGYDGPAGLERELSRRASSSLCALRLARTGARESRRILRASRGGPRRGDEGAVAAAAVDRFGPCGVGRSSRHLLALGRRPDGPLGATTRDRDAAFARLLVEALAGAADPEQATRLARGLLRAPRDAGALRPSARRRSAHGPRAHVLAWRQCVSGRGARRPSRPGRRVPFTPEACRRRRSHAGGSTRRSQPWRKTHVTWTPSSARSAARNAGLRSRLASPTSRGTWARVKSRTP